MLAPKLKRHKLLATCCCLSLLCTLLNTGHCQSEQAGNRSQPQPSSTGQETRPDGRQLAQNHDDDLIKTHAGSLSQLDLTAADSMMSTVSATGHEILASGWPATSPLWPSLETERHADSGNQSSERWEPFIYADEPSKQDYSLLLSLNATLIEMLKANFQRQPPQLSADLSLEYYFNHGPEVTALPGIKLEVDRKELDYLEPSRMGGSGEPVAGKSGRLIKDKMWVSYNKRLQLVDSGQLDKPDWLKLSLVNREAPSLVAIRRLRVVFGSETNLSNLDQLAAVGGQHQTRPPAHSGPAAPPPVTEAPVIEPEEAPQVPLPPPAPQRSPPSGRFNPPEPSSRPPPRSRTPSSEAPDERDQPPQFSPSGNQLESQAESDLVPQSSNVLTSTIKPVEPKTKKGWAASILGRKKRQASTDHQGSDPQAAASRNSTGAVQLTCYRSDACEHWKVEQTKWSLARMPPATGSVQIGYYYVSNREKYGDLSRPLLLRLNQTETATITDQNSDHCIKLALYVTERTRLRLFKMVRRDNGTTTSADEPEPAADGEESGWVKSSQLLVWAPTTTIVTRAGANVERAHLNGAFMAAGNASGWTQEALCFGQFFENDRKCGVGECAFAFEMDTQDGGEPVRAQHRAEETDDHLADGATEHSAAHGQEQVVGVALLGKFAENAPNKQVAPARWLEFWQRSDVRPHDNWRFYPEMDFEERNASLILRNLYNGAQYSIHSDWVQVGEHLNLNASLLIEVLPDEENSRGLGSAESTNQTSVALAAGVERPGVGPENDELLFRLQVERRLVNQHFETLYSMNKSIEWLRLKNNDTAQAKMDLDMANLSELIGHATTADSERPSLFKVIVNVALDCHWLAPATGHSEQANTEGTAESTRDLIAGHVRTPRFSLSLTNVSLADRCDPSPCKWGTCRQNGTAPEDWECNCDREHRGRRCEFGNWCSLAHVAPPSSSSGQTVQAQQPFQVAPPALVATGNQKQQQDSNGTQLIILKTSQQPANGANPGAASSARTQAAALNPVLVGKSDGATTRLSGEEFCKRKLGPGFRCQDIDFPLDDRLYQDEGETFSCFCRDDFYLSDDGKCKQAHKCNSIVCPAPGQICDESRPFNESQPCHCNEKQDWYQESPSEPNKCTRRQCHDKKRDCGFDAHVCLALSAGERPICRCAPKFVLKTAEKTGQKYCQSMACVLPTLNDCEHICAPNDLDLERPYTCSCHAGYTLDKDGKSCKPTPPPAASQPGSHRHVAAKAGPVCKPACDSRTQICTELGCRCRQGYVAEGEIVVQVQAPPSMRNSTGASTTSGLVNYVKSVQCLNVCSLKYAENKFEFERIESVCPLGLCDPVSFNCRCSDPDGTALVHSKYEPIWATNATHGDEAGSHQQHTDEEGGPATTELATAGRKRASPLCQLKRVCQPESASYRWCKDHKATCVPDYTKQAMYDCVCPPSTEKRQIVVGQQADFVCEPRCNSIKQECLKKQAVCRPTDRDQVRCECLPGMMLDKHDDKCYLAHFTYSLSLIIVNKYYEPIGREQAAHSQQDSNNGKKSETDGESNHHDQSSVPTSSDDDHQGAPPLQELVPQFQKSSLRHGLNNLKLSHSYLSRQQCNISQLLPKSVIEDPYEHDTNAFLQYIEQCNERLHEDSRTFSLNSRLGEDLRQSLRQHLRSPFTVTTNNSLCLEVVPQQADGVASSVSYLNCTVFLQSMEPIEAATIDRAFTNCDKTGLDGRFCWIKPRLLLMKPMADQQVSTTTTVAADQNQTDGNSQSAANPFGFRQIVACELDGFCGAEARSERLDETSSLCSCKCPSDIEMIDLRDLEPRLRALVPHVGPPTGRPEAPPEAGTNLLQVQAKHLSWPNRSGVNLGGAVKEICAPRNHCGPNSTLCSRKTGSQCLYDIRTGSRCVCVYPSYEDEQSRCVEIAFSRLDNTLIVVIIMVGTCLVVSLAINLYALAKSKRGLFGQSRQYPLSEFSSSAREHHQLNHQNNSNLHQPPYMGDADERHHPRSGRPFNRSTGVPNLAFDPDD